MKNGLAVWNITSPRPARASISILDQNGNTVSSEYDAINNIGHRSQKSDGGTVQLTFDQPVFGLQNQLVTGVDYIARALRLRQTSDRAAMKRARKAAREQGNA